jgi:hypothetical protein
MKAGMGCFVAFISVFYLVGFGVLGYAVWSAWRSTQVASWPTTQGIVTNLALKESSDNDGTTYEVQVEYDYTVAGTLYRGSRLAFGYTASSGRDAHMAIHDKLKAAKIVDVHYDPADPASSALSFGIHRSIQFTLAFAITWLAFVIGFTLIWWLASRGDDVLLQNLSVQ